MTEVPDIPPLERAIRLVDMVAYAGATWDWHRLHYDRDYLDARGLDRPVVDGQALGAYLAEQLLDALGPRAFVRRMAFRFRGMVLAGEVIRCEAEVTGVEERDEGVLVAVRQRVLAGGRVVIDGASAEVVLPP